MKDNRTRVFLRPGSIAFRSQFSGFLTDEQSPFRDRYDWLQEERVVDELIASGIDAGSKEYARIIEYEGRISVLKMWVFQHLKDNGLLRTNASIKNLNLDDYQIVLKNSSASKREHGSYRPSGVNGVWLHSGEARDVFVGNYAENKTDGAVGCIQAAHNVSKLFYENKNPNPYVDQALINIELKYDEIFKSIETQSAQLNKKLEQSKNEGFVFNEVESSGPKFYSMDFTCQYATQFVKLVHKFDGLCRLLATLYYGGELTRDEFHKSKTEYMSKLRNLFFEVSIQTKVLTKDDFNKSLHYEHWLNADEAMIETLAKIAVSGWGVVDDRVLVRKLQPKFSVSNMGEFKQKDADVLLKANEKIRVAAKSLSGVSNVNA